MNNKTAKLTSADEEKNISRKMVIWANTYPDSPVAIINYEQLSEKTESMALSTIQGAFVKKKFVTGGHLAEYQFKVIYRLYAGSSNDARLTADEMLNGFGDWAATNRPELGDDILVRSLEPVSRSSLFAAYDDGMEDHQILLKLTYEVMK